MPTMTSKRNIGLTADQLENTARLLNQLLADENLLYIKTRNYHWNVEGRMFRSLHELFEEQYTQLADDIDEIAERVRSLGQKAIGTTQEFTEHSHLKEHPGQYPKALEMVENLAADHEAVIRFIRSEVDNDWESRYGDTGTNDFLVALMEKHEKNAWMLRSIAAEG